MSRLYVNNEIGQLFVVVKDSIHLLSRNPFIIAKSDFRGQYNARLPGTEKVTSILDSYFVSSYRPLDIDISHSLSQLLQVFLSKATSHSSEYWLTILEGFEAYPKLEGAARGLVPYQYLSIYDFENFDLIA